MAREANLIQRNGRWYFNHAYPKHLWPITGKSPFRLSLNTDSLEEAPRQRGAADNAIGLPSIRRASDGHEPSA